MKVVVFTATGDQGSSVCKYALEAGYEVYGITRNKSSPSAQALASQGVHLIQGDMSTPSSYSSVLLSIHPDGAFINTDFWSKYMSNGFDPLLAQQEETHEAKMAVNACVEAGVKHLVYSTLDDTEKGQCPHYESKAEVTAYLKTKPMIPVTNIYTSSYFSNLSKFGMLKHADDGWVLAMPAPDDMPLPSFAVEQLGKWVVAAWKNPERWIGQDMQACSDTLTVSQMANVLSTLTNNTIQVQTLGLSKEQFYTDAHKTQVGEEMWLALKLILEDGMPRDIEASKEVVPDQLDFEAWAKQSPELKEMLKF